MHFLHPQAAAAGFTSWQWPLIFTLILGFNAINALGQEYHFHTGDQMAAAHMAAPQLPGCATSHLADASINAPLALNITEYCLEESQLNLAVHSNAFLTFLDDKDKSNMPEGPRVVVEAEAQATPVTKHAQNNLPLLPDKNYQPLENHGTQIAVTGKFPERFGVFTPIPPDESHNEPRMLVNFDETPTELSMDEFILFMLSNGDYIVKTEKEPPRPNRATINDNESETTSTIVPYRGFRHHHRGYGRGSYHSTGQSTAILMIGVQTLWGGISGLAKALKSLVQELWFHKDPRIPQAYGPPNPVFTPRATGFPSRTELARVAAQEIPTFILELFRPKCLRRYSEARMPDLAFSEPVCKRLSIQWPSCVRIDVQEKDIALFSVNADAARDGRLYRATNADIIFLRQYLQCCFLAPFLVLFLVGLHRSKVRRRTWEKEAFAGEFIEITPSEIPTTGGSRLDLTTNVAIARFDRFGLLKAVAVWHRNLLIEAQAFHQCLVFLRLGILLHVQTQFSRRMAALPPAMFYPEKAFSELGLKAEACFMTLLHITLSNFIIQRSSRFVAVKDLVNRSSTEIDWFARNARGLFDIFDEKEVQILPFFLNIHRHDYLLEFHLPNARRSDDSDLTIPLEKTSFNAAAWTLNLFPSQKLLDYTTEGSIDKKFDLFESVTAWYEAQTNNETDMDHGEKEEEQVVGYGGLKDVASVLEANLDHDEEVVVCGPCMSLYGLTSHEEYLRHATLEFDLCQLRNDMEYEEDQLFGYLDELQARKEAEQVTQIYFESKMLRGEETKNEVRLASEENKENVAPRVFKSTGAAASIPQPTKQMKGKLGKKQKAKARKAAKVGV